MIFFMITVIFLINIVFWILLTPRSKRKYLNYLFTGVSFIGMLIFSGARGLEVGTDTFMYVRYFNSVSGLQDIDKYSDRFEIGFRLFTCSIAGIFTNPHALLFISTLITLIFFYLVVYKTSKVPWYTILLFIALLIFFNSMCLSRQYIAIAFTSLAMWMYCEKKYINASIALIVAISFHGSAAIVLLLIPLYGIKITKKNRLLLFIGAGIFFMVFNQLIDTLIKFLPQYSGYLSSDYYLQNEIGTILKSGVWGALFFFQDYNYFNNRNNYNEENGWGKIEYYCSLLAFIISIISIKGAILERMGLYFSIINCIGIANALNRMKSRNNKYLWGTIIMSCCIAYGLVITILRPYWAGIIPYTFWQL